MPRWNRCGARGIIPLMRRHAAALVSSVILFGSGCSTAQEPTVDSPAAPTAPSVSPEPSVGTSTAPAIGIETMAVGRSPWGVAYGYGSVWVPTAQALVRVDASTDEVLARIPIPQDLNRGTTVSGDPGIYNWAAVGEGGVWVTIARRELTVLHIDPRTDAVVGVIRAGIAPGRPTPLAVGAGVVWVANPASHELVRIDPATDRVIDTIRLQGFPPVEASGVAVAGGAIWVMDHASATLLRVDPSAGKVVDRVRLDTSGRLTGSGSEIWAASAGESTIQSVDARTGKPNPVIETCAGVNNVAPTDSLIWVATGTAVLCALDPTGEDNEVLDLPASGGIVVAHGRSAWISLPTEGAVAHVEYPAP